MKIKDVSYTEHGIQVVVEERAAIKDKGTFTRSSPSPRHKQIAKAVQPPITRNTELVSVDRCVFCGGLAQMQFSWKWM